MAANSSLDLTSLDFDTLKTKLKDFLKYQDAFKDYNFDGANMNVLLDILSYNSYLNAFYLNMVASEMFMDSAQKLDSVVSHAKELNYVPQSYKSSQANVNIVFETIGLNGKLTIPQGTIFTGSNANGSFSFVTSYTASYTSPNNTFYANNVEIFEGSYTSDSFILDYSVPEQKFVISNQNVDLNSLTVNVVEDNGISNTMYTRAINLFGLNGNSAIYFLQAARDGKYEILFGDGVFGKRPQNGAVVKANYRIARGAMADGVSSFQLIQDLDEANGGVVNVEEVTTVSNSSSGSSSETIESVRFRAPRWYATQERGVSNDDYKSLITARFGSYVQDMNVFGGQEVEPKQYGAVIIAVKPYGSTILPDYLKNEIRSYLLDKSQMRVVVRDPDYLYLKVETVIQYDKTKTSLYVNDIKNLAMTAISNFSFNNLEKFDSDFRYSKFVAAIDSIESSITSNDTRVHVVKKLTPLLGYTMTYDVDFNNSADIEDFDPSIGYNEYTQFGDEPVITSTAFTYLHSDGIEYPLSYIRDDNKGNLVVFTNINNVFTILNPSVGTIDYHTGRLTLSNFTVTAYNQYIEIQMHPKNKDVIVNKDKILIIDPIDVSITIEDHRL